ncbi:MAG: DAK2 domain-containing protein [Acidimicrobiales bacterium]
MNSPSTLSAKGLRASIITYGELLHSHREVINRLNVYPVPDGDTGTNMARTIESVVVALSALDDDAPLGEVSQAIAKGSLMGARGNSGVILSQLLRGLVASFPAQGEVSALELADALHHADELARQAVVRPVEGTILSIARAGAEGALAHKGSLVDLARGARDAAKQALAKTPEQLAVLKQAGVVDSGGSGLVLLFDALAYEFARDELPTPPRLDSIKVHVHEDPSEHSLSQPRYEVMYLLDADDAKMAGFGEVWAGLGDSIVIVGGDGLYNCHIHTDDVGAAVEASLDVGRPHEIRVTDLDDQVIEERWVREATQAMQAAPVSEAPTTSVVAVVVGDGVGRIFRSLGVRQMVYGGQSMNPSTSELADAVRATGSSQVIVLPNNKNITPVANEVGALVHEHVAVVATSSIVEGFAALLAYDPDASLEANATAMRASACNVVAGEVTRAVRDSATDAGDVHEGDWIGLGSSGVLAIADSIAAASNQLLTTLIRPEHELLTIIEGDGSTPANTRRITDFLAETYPQIMVEVHHGGQPLYPYYFGLE